MRQVFIVKALLGDSQDEEGNPEAMAVILAKSIEEAEQILDGAQETTGSRIYARRIDVPHGKERGAWILTGAKYTDLNAKNSGVLESANLG